MAWRTRLTASAASMVDEAEVKSFRAQVAQLGGEQGLVPAGVERELIVGSRKTRRDVRRPPHGAARSMDRTRRSA